MNTRSAARFALAAIVFIVLFPVITHRERMSELAEPGHLVCVLDLQGGSTGGMAYPIGFEYEMLRAFARSQGCTVEIILSSPEDSISDYLSVDSVSIVARSLSDTLGWPHSRAMADSAVWMVRDGEMRRIVDRWLALYSCTAEYSSLRDRFTPSYEPSRRAASGGQYPCGGPYDDIVRKYAASLGWDWHMLEALVWQESKFHIEARSRRGAVGLMQMMPSTARRYGVDDMLDPEENIAAGVRYLSRLQAMFAPYASPEDLPKFTLAAYNAGEGRILDCIRFASAQELPCRTWAEMESVIPRMRADSLAPESDSILRHGPFKGRETIAYIHATDSLAALFRTIVP